MRPQKRSFSIRGHRTSISLEAPFWQALREISEHRAMPLAALVAEIDESRGGDVGLSTAVRLYVLTHLQDRLRTQQALARRDTSGSGSNA